MRDQRFLVGLAASFLAAALCGAAAALLRPSTAFPAAAGLLESALAQGFIFGYSMDLRAAEPAAPPAAADVDSLYRDALILYVQQDPQKAVQLLERAAKAAPKNEKVRNALARIRQELGR